MKIHSNSDFELVGPAHAELIRRVLNQRHAVCTEVAR